MVLGALVKAGQIAAPFVARAAIRYSRAEGRVFNRLYGTSRGRGVRHGLAAGGVIGSLIGSGGDDSDNGSIPKKGNGPKTGKSNQARGRYISNSRSRYSSRQQRCKCHRYSNSRRYN